MLDCIIYVVITRTQGSFRWCGRVHGGSEHINVYCPLNTHMHTADADTHIRSHVTVWSERRLEVSVVGQDSLCISL